MNRNRISVGTIFAALLLSVVLLSCGKPAVSRQITVFGASQ